MDILLKPDSLCLAGSMNHFVISTNNEIAFVLKYADTDTTVVQHTYTPNKSNRIEVNLESVVLPLLSFELKDVTEAYRQPSIVRKFTAVFSEVGTSDTESWSFSVLRAGVDHFSDSALNWLKANFLTWQPTVKPVTYYTPEFLTYYAVVDSVVKCKAYVETDGVYAETDLTMVNLSSGSAWTIPTQYAIIAGKLNKLPSYYDVWVEDADGKRLTYIQRYYASDIRSEQEQWVLFENSLGGVDTFRAYGESENTAKHTHNIAEIENDSEEYRVDTTREFKKNTGFLTEGERKWLLDFFPSLGKYLFVNSYIRRIVVTESDVSWQAKELPSSYTFTYKYADARPYLNLSRTDKPADILNIKIPDIGSFTVAPRLVELDRLPLSGGALFPVQNPYSDHWNVTTAAAILDFLAHEITSAYKGDGSFGHTHDNMSVLAALQRFGQYLTLDGQKVSAGYADTAGVASALDEKSADWDKIVRTDKPSTVRALISFLKDIAFGEFIKESSGAGIYADDNGNWHIEGDYFHIRKKLTAEEVEIMRSTHIKGKIINSPGDFVISKIERISGAWRCYFTKQDADGRVVSNTMGLDDFAYYETFNLVDNNGKASNRYWHRRVIGLGDDYVDVADNTNPDDYASGSDEPQVGDEASTLGNKTNPERQHAIIQAAADTGSPYYRMYVGINSFSLPKPKIQMSPTEGSWWIVTDDNGNELTIEDYLASLKNQVKAVQEQQDKQIVLWFGDGIPTLDNEPSSTWLDDFTRSEHLHDIYYNRGYAKTGGGRAYSFEKTDDGTYRWKEITDADVLTSLEAANKAQDTADGKRRVFVAQPTNEQAYDVGDLWVNATYKDGSVSYANDLLRCVTAKAAGDTFTIAHWTPVQQYTTSSLTAIEQRAGKIVSAVAGNEKTMERLLNDIDKGDETDLLTMQGRYNAVFSSLTSTADLLHAAVWDDEGNLKGYRNVGLMRSVTDENGSLTLFADRYDADGNRTSSAGIHLTASDDGSALRFSADQINFLGTTTINGNFVVDDDGNVTMKNCTVTDCTVTGTVNATAGRIAGFKIAGTGLTNVNDDGTFTNDAYIIFRNDTHKCFVGIGGNVLPTTSGVRAVGRFENEDMSDWWGLGSNYALILSAKNAAYNFAFAGTGNGFLNGTVEGYGCQSVTCVQNMISEINYSKGNKVLFTNSASNTGLALPTIDNMRRSLGVSNTIPFAVTLTLIQAGGTTVGDVVYGRNASVYSGTTSKNYWMNTNAYPQMYDNDRNSVGSISMGQGDCLSLMLVYNGSEYCAYILNKNWEI